MFEFPEMLEDFGLFIFFALLSMALMLAMVPLRVRRRRTALWAVLAVLCYAVFFFLGYSGLLHVILPSPNRILLITMATTLFCNCLFDVSYKRMFIIATLVFYLVQFIACIYVMLRVLTELGTVWSAVIFAVCIAVVLGSYWIGFMRRFRRDINVEKSFDRNIYTAGIFGLVIALILYNLLMYSGATATVYGLVSFFVYLAVYLVAFINSYFRAQMAYLERAQKAISEQKEKEFQAFISSVDVLNIKLHDLKRYAQAVSSLEGEGADEYILELKDAVDVYNSMSNTGNYELDAIISEKKLECDRKGIAFDYVIDARDLGFISSLDLYMLFGNALDNAIDACAREEEDRRLITLNAGRCGSIVFINIENPCSASPGFRKGMPVTTKGDTSSHGFGTASIKSIACKYGGNAEFSYTKGVFAVNIIFPVQEKPQDKAEPDTAA